MVVDEPRPLEVGVDNHRPHKAEAPLFQVGAHPAGQVVLGGHVLRPLQPVVHRHAVHPVPEVAGKAAPLLRHGQKGPGIGDGAAGLAPVFDDAGGGQSGLHLVLPHPASAAGSKSAKAARRAAAASRISFQLSPALKASSSSSSNQRPVVPAGPAPLRVVVQNLMLRFCPGTARALSHVSSLLSFPARLGRETRYHLHYSIEMGKWKPAGKVIAEKKFCK